MNTNLRMMTMMAEDVNIPELRVYTPDTKRISFFKRVLRFFAA